MCGSCEHDNLENTTGIDEILLYDIGIYECLNGINDGCRSLMG